MDLGLLFVFTNVCVGFFIGIFIGMTGVGGGVLIQPALIHILKLSPVTAVGTGLAYALITKIGGTISHFRLKTIQGRKVFYFLIGGIPGVLITSKIINILAKQAADPAKFNAYLQITIGIVLVVSAIILAIQTVAVGHQSRSHPGEKSKELPLPRGKIAPVILSGLVIGGLMGATSIGGGILIIPLFLIYMGSTAQQAVGSSIVISIFLSGLGGVVYFINGSVQLLNAVLLCLGSLPGVYLGSRVSVNMSEKVLKIIITLIVAISGISLFFGISFH